MCPEMGICELPSGEEQSLGYRIEHLTGECENTLVILLDNKELEETPTLIQLLQSIDLVETRHHIKCRREEWAIIRNYPSLKDHWNVRVAIPSPDWEEPERRSYKSKTEFEKALKEWNWKEKAEKEAWEALIYKGKDDPKWIAWIQWVSQVQLPAYTKVQQKEVWERWKRIGLPVLSFKETLGK